MQNVVKILLTAQDNASRVLENVRASMDRMGRTAGVLTSSLALIGVGSGGALGLVAKEVINGVDALNDLKDATGASIETLSALEDVAMRTGTSMGSVGTALVKFNSVLKDTKPGSDAAAILDGLGLSLEALKTMDPGEALRTTAVALARITDDGTKARVVQELFGKSVREVAPFLKDLAEQGALVAKVTTEQADEAERFNKQMFNLQKNVQDGARALTGALLPALNDSIERFKLAYSAAGSFFGALRLYKGLDYGQDIQGNLDRIDKEIAALREREKLLTHDSAKKGNDYQIADLQAQSQYLKQLRQIRVLEGQGDTGDAVSRRFNRSPVFNFPTEKPADKPAGKTGLSDAAKEELRFQKELLDAKRQVTIDEGKAVEDRNEKYQQALADEIAAREKYYSVLQQELAATQANNATLANQAEEIGLTTAQVNALRLARMDATIAQEQHTLAVKDAHGADAQEIGLLERRIALLQQQRNITAKGQVAQADADTKEEQDRASKEYASTLRNDLKGALSTAFRDTKDPLAAFGDALANTIFTRATNALAESMITGMMGMGPGGTGGSGILGSLFSFEGGGSTGSAPRTGGMDGKGGFLALLHPRETVTDHTLTANQASAAPAQQPIIINQYNTIGDVASMAQVKRQLDANNRALSGTLMRQNRYGGALA